MKEKMISFVEGSEPYQVEISARLVGDDLVAIVEGGELPHVGAVAVSIPRPSLADASEVSSSTSIFTFVGHKEDMLARTMAAGIASALQRNVVLTTGIHVDNIPAEGIEVVENNCRKVLEKLILHFAPR
ncbi:MAG TPA: hypothetical protein GXZ24_05860 [Firmicutes bacterium]|jgi:hypothetical protein|nr:hypothetical protein [Bacillota bacterium]